jgi:hypothetical protein
VVGERRHIELFKIEGAHGEVADGPSRYGLHHIAIYVEDLDEAAAGFEEAGGAMLDGPIELGDFTPESFSYSSDPLKMHSIKLVPKDVLANFCLGLTAGFRKQSPAHVRRNAVYWKVVSPKSAVHPHRG